MVGTGGVEVYFDRWLVVYLDAVAAHVCLTRVTDRKCCGFSKRVSSVQSPDFWTTAEVGAAQQTLNIANTNTPITKPLIVNPHQYV